jgi:uncharacterized protein
MAIWKRHAPSSSTPSTYQPDCTAPASVTRTGSARPGLRQNVVVPGETDLSTTLRNLNPQLRPDQYVFTVVDEVPPGTDHFATVAEHEGITLVVTQAVAETLGLAYVEVFAMITLGVHSSLSSVGLTAAVAQRLAEAGIGCNVLAGAHHDHLFVPLARGDEALGVLRGLSSEERERPT